MYSLDRRYLARHLYSLLPSVRKTALLLQVSPATISRWLRHPHRKIYTFSKIPLSKSTILRETIRTCVKNDPFLSLRKLQRIILDVHSVQVSLELLRCALKSYGFSRKKAKAVSATPRTPSLVQDFLHKRNEFLKQGKRFVSLDETAFGRNTKPIYGYSLRGKNLYTTKKHPRIDTTSALTTCSDSSVNFILHKGSFNTSSFLEGLSSLYFAPDTVIILDNVSFHHSPSIKDFAKRHNLHLLFTPPYSPWFNPVEGVFSIVKRRFYQSWDIEDSFAHVRPEHCRAFFSHSLSH